MAHTNAKVSAKFIDKYGDEREIHHSKGRLMVKRQDNALFLTINPPICKIIGKRISELRKKKKMSLEQLCIGMTDCFELLACTAILARIHERLCADCGQWNLWHRCLS